jgi:hypothetical protein
MVGKNVLRNMTGTSPEFNSYVSHGSQRNLNDHQFPWNFNAVMQHRAIPVTGRGGP